jgi:dienelactone hydrolase
MTITRTGSDDGVLEYRFEAPGLRELVPGLLWRPGNAAAAAATVLVGHGRTSDKSGPWILALVRLFAARGLNVVAIDAPGHGDRRAAHAADWPRPDQDEATADWQAALRLLGDEAGLDLGRLAYWGVSMGAALGLSLIAGDPRFQAAVLGLMHPNWPAPPGTRIRADARRLLCPVLFLVNWDDTRAPREQAFELFDLIGSPDKRLWAYPGEHGLLPGEAFAGSADFLARHLTTS